LLLLRLLMLAAVLAGLALALGPLLLGIPPILCLARLLLLFFCSHLVLLLWLA
jgi:hypothetical protein